LAYLSKERENLAVDQGKYQDGSQQYQEHCMQDFPADALNTAQI